MITRRDARTDKNEHSIIQALEKAGALVYRIKWPLDLLVAFRGSFYVLEVKTPGSSLNDNQAEVVKEMLLRGCTPGIVYSAEDALKSIGAVVK